MFWDISNSASSTNPLVRRTKKGTSSDANGYVCFMMQDAIWKIGLHGPFGCSTVFDPCLSDFDAVIMLRRDSIPVAHLALQLPSTHMGATPARQLPQLLAHAGFSGHEEDSVVPPTNARALLRTIPSRERHPAACSPDTGDDFRKAVLITNVLHILTKPSFSGLLRLY
jgi:hypothetical protein